VLDQHPEYGGSNLPAYGGGATQTIMHPAVMLALVLAIILLLVLPRKYAILPFLILIFLCPRGQQFYLAGQHWYVLRILGIVGLVRLAKEHFEISGGLNGIDKAFIVWAIYRGICPVLQFKEVGLIPGQVGLWLETFGTYFLLRHLIQGEEDIARAAKSFALLALILGACMLNETIHKVDVFGYLGGAPLTPVVRSGSIRAQAVFAHAILAGSCGATLLPLFFWLWKSRKSKPLAIIGAVGCSLMVYASASSTPLFAYAGGLLGLALWPFRRSMRQVRWGIVLTLVGLHLVMKAPVWLLIARVNPMGSSDAYGRAMLMDNLIRHFWDWWLIGSNQTANWGWGMWDLCNQFVAEGEVGGLLTLVCFLAIISRSFSRLGKMRWRVEGDRKEEWLFWCLCAVMVAHIFAFFGISYFDQTRVWWWAFLAMISAATVGLKAKKKPQAQEEPSLVVDGVAVGKAGHGIA
jgi:hypothetical protein